MNLNLSQEFLSKHLKNLCLLTVTLDLKEVNTIFSLLDAFPFGGLIFK